MQRFIGHLKRLAHDPFEALVGVFETYGSWSTSRSWRLLGLLLPVPLGVAAIFAYAAISSAIGEQRRIQAYLELADRQVQLDRLETELYRDIVKLEPSEGDDIAATVAVAVSQPAEAAAPLAGQAAGTPETADQPPTPADIAVVRHAMERVLQIDPNYGEGEYRLAVTLALQGELSRAEELIASIVERPGIPNLAAYHWRAVTLLNQSREGRSIQPRELERVFEKAAEWRKANRQVRFAQAELLARQGKVDQALELEMTTAEEEPRSYLRVALHAKQAGKERVAQEAIRRSERYFEDRLKSRLNPADLVDDNIGYAQTLLMDGRRDEAIAKLQLEIGNSRTPQPKLKLTLSNIYLDEFLSSRGPGDATDPSSWNWEALAKAAEVDPLNPLLGRKIAELLGNPATTDDVRTYGKGQIVEVLSRQVAANQISPETLMLLGTLYYQRKLYEQAENYWEKVVELQPTAAAALNNLAYLQIEKEPPQVARGLELAARAYELAPRNAEVCDTYGQILLKADRPLDAIAMLERALKLSSNLPPEQQSGREKTRQLLADAYSRIGEPEVGEAYRKYVSQTAEPVQSQASDPELNAEAGSEEDAPKPAAVEEVAPAEPEETAVGAG